MLPFDDTGEASSFISHAPLLVCDGRCGGSNTLNELVAGFGVAVIAGAESRVIGFLKLGGISPFDRRIQFSHLRLQNSIQDT
jgi:hypothetical protein